MGGAQQGVQNGRAPRERCVGPAWDAGPTGLGGSRMQGGDAGAARRRRAPDGTQEATQGPAQSHPSTARCCSGFGASWWLRRGEQHPRAGPPSTVLPHPSSKEPHTTQGKTSTPKVLQDKPMPGAAPAQPWDAPEQGMPPGPAPPLGAAQGVAGWCPTGGCSSPQLSPRAKPLLGQQTRGARKAACPWVSPDPAKSGVSTAAPTWGPTAQNATGLGPVRAPRAPRKRGWGQRAAQPGTTSRAQPCSRAGARSLGTSSGATCILFLPAASKRAHPGLRAGGAWPATSNPLLHAPAPPSLAGALAGRRGAAGTVVAQLLELTEHQAP